MVASSASAKTTPEAQLRSFVAKFDPKDQKVFRSLRSAVRKRLPGTNELVYDYDANLVIGFSPTDRAIDGILSISLRVDGVRLYFVQGKKLVDPKKILKGSGKQTRFLEVQAASELNHPDVEALIAAEIANASVPLPAEGRGDVIIRSVSAEKKTVRKPKRA